MWRGEQLGKRHHKLNHTFEPVLAYVWQVRHTVLRFGQSIEGRRVMKNASSLKTHPTTRAVLLCLLVAVFFAWLSPPAMSMDRDAWVRSQIKSTIPERLDEWPWVDGKSVSFQNPATPFYQSVITVLVGALFPPETEVLEVRSETITENSSDRLRIPELSDVNNFTVPDSSSPSSSRR